MTAEPNSSELFNLAKEYLDKVELMTREVTEAVSSLDKIRLHFENSFSQRLQNWMKFFSPYFVIFVIFIVFRLMPCGSVFEFLNVKLIAPTCSQNEIQH